MASVYAKVGVRILLVLLVVGAAYLIHYLINLNKDFPHISMYDALENIEEGLQIRA